MTTGQHRALGHRDSTVSIRTLCWITPRNHWYILETERVLNQLRLPRTCLKLPQTLRFVDLAESELYDPESEHLCMHNVPWVDNVTEDGPAENHLSPFSSVQTRKQRAHKARWGSGTLEPVDLRRWRKLPAPAVSELRATKQRDEERLRKESLIRLRASKSR
ncbi:hypothetical protein FBUS_07638 [Fasciolopsis buskii]|uniref:Uncharacterized protein n=1 Tax=Fasciolopsis buskii TaxID=27845 RepID=A0A8E0VIY0_9TREM|nr:hypothetical protein FBUS_07638 [Fasciolopsis buski]